MRSFSQTSLARLATCDPELQRLFNEVLQRVDCTVICGHRAEEAQNKAVAEGKSQTKWPHSKHNSLPSRAVDAGPWPLYWYDLKSFDQFAAVVKTVAAELNIEIEWGGDWVSFKDRPHFQLKGK